MPAFILERILRNVTNKLTTISIFSDDIWMFLNVSMNTLPPFVFYLILVTDYVQKDFSQVKNSRYWFLQHLSR